MRILAIQESDWFHRGPHQQHHILERLSAKGHEIRVIDFPILWRTQENQKLFSPREVFLNSQKLSEKARITVIRPTIIRLPVFDKVSLAFTHKKEIQEQIKNFKPDIVIGHSILNSSIALELSRKHHIPFVYHVLDALHTLLEFAPYRTLAKRLESKCFSKADLVIVINRSLRDYAVKMGAKPEKTVVIPAGVDLSRFDASPIGVRIRRSLGVEEDDLLLFFMGWLYPFSGLREIVTAMAGDSNKTHLKLLVVGDGDLFPELERIVSQNGLAGRVILVGRQPYETIPGYLAAADVCILPSQRNSTMENIVPIKVYEYMAMAKTVIATQLPGLVSEFGQSSGIVFVKDQGQVIPKAIRLSDEGRLPEIGRRALDSVRARDWETITRAFEKSIESCVG